MPVQRHSLRGFWKNAGGANFVEFSLVAPFLVLLTVGIIDFGRAMWTSTTIEHVARESARYASLHGADSVSVATETSVQSYAGDRATGLDTGAMNITVTWAGNSNATGSSVTVEVDYDFDLLLTGFFGIAPVTLESSSTMVIL